VRKRDEIGGRSPQRSVFIGQHEREDRVDGVAGADVEFHRVLRPGDDDRKEDLLGVACRAESKFSHGGDIVANSFSILAWPLQGFVENCPYCRRARERVFPVLTDRIDVAQVNEHTVCNGLSPGVGIDGFTKRIFTGHDFVPFGPCSVFHRT
jgi:hypothetical protein